MVNINSEYQAAHFPNLLATGLAVKATGKTIVHGYVVGSQDNTITHYVKFYDIAVAPDENDTPKFIVCVPQDDVVAMSIPGVTFRLGCWVRACVEPANSGATAPSASDITAAVFYS